MSGIRNPKIWLVMNALLLCISGITTAIERHVPSQYSTIQAAIDAAVDGDEVVMAPGTYTGDGNRDIDFLGKAITVRSVDPNDPNIVAATIIDCNGTQIELHQGFYFHNGEETNSVLDGLTIINGNAEYGGAVYCQESNPTIARCVINGNTSMNGGGVFCSFSSPIIDQCTISGNAGSGIFYSCSNPIISNCNIIGNISNGTGGGILCSISRSNVINCTIIGNTARGQGGGIYILSSEPNITNCIISNNSAKGAWVEGGGIFSAMSSPEISDCIISANTSDWGGGGIFCSESLTIGNSTITGNSARHGSGISCGGPRKSNIKIINCIVWFNGLSIARSANAVVTYSNVQGGWTGTGNINADPCFIDAKNGDFHLLPESPCINAGDPNFIAETNETDIDGESRVMLGRVDMGADEWPGPWMIYVDSDAKGANDGSSWGNAYNYLQDALADANSAEKPVEIRVAQGIYKPDKDTMHPTGTGDRTAAFQLINGVNIKGGYVGHRMSLSGADPDVRNIKLYETILSGDIGAPSDANDNCYHVFYHPEGLNLNATAILDGFTITGGNANSTSDPHTYGGGMLNDRYNSPRVTNCIFSGNSAVAGGGMFNWDGSPTVKDCIFTVNSANNGGGMFNYEDSNPIVEDCTFSDNSVRYHGGGMFNYERSSPTVTNCKFSGNLAEYRGGGMCNGSYSSPTVNNCTFTENSAEDDGGGMCNNYYDSNPTVNNCTFSNNSANDYGGGMHNYKSSPTLTNCAFSGNSAIDGGGMDNDYSRPTVEGCTFSGNSAERYGGGMLNFCSGPTVTNCTFSRNSASRGGGMGNGYSSPTVTNCILWADVPSEIYGATPIVTYSDVQGGYAGTGNINADPCFVGPDSNDFHLLPNSPCINAGDPNFIAEPNETDIDGESRVMLGRVDMGADEFNPFTATFEVVNKRRTDRTVFEYDCKITVSNRWHSALKNLQLELAKVPDNMTIVDPQVSFADTELEPGQSLTSIDTCTFRVDRSQPIDSAEIAWWVRCDIIDTGQTVQHTASSILYLEPENRTGELTGEGKIGFEDLAEMAGRWLKADGDGVVNFIDFARIAEKWQGQ